MKKVLTKARLPIKCWFDAGAADSGAIDQATNLANLQFAYKHVALMADSHLGFGMPIGGVLAALNTVIPNGVGVDIGCGMATCKTKLKVEDISVEQLKKIMKEIRQRIPVGFAKHKEPQALPLPLHRELCSCLDQEIIRREQSKVPYQYGTLGGGNHFIELQKDSKGILWVMLHSGSRHLGLVVAAHYNKLAKELNERWQSNVPKDLAFLPTRSDKGIDYIKKMTLCLNFARANRDKMMDEILFSIKKVLDIQTQISDGFLDVHHNYVDVENHFGKNVWVHRKGAIRARKGERGIIPGSQGTSSYIVEGLGNEPSFMSCSHGAGRKLSRRQAKETLDLAVEKKKLDDLGIIHSVRNLQDLDEASGAYKDIDEVMENQKDLVKIVTKLSPLAVIKG